jgi:heterodisulfide reductase subunit B
MPHIKEKNTFMQGGQNVAIKRNNEVRIVPLCNGCITLYYERGWLAVKK